MATSRSVCQCITDPSCEPAREKRKTATSGGGQIHLPLQREDRKINLELQAPVKAQPNQALKLHLKASKTKGDLPEKLHVIVSAVDSGV